MKKLSTMVLVLLSLLIVGCSHNVSPNVYNASELGVKSKVEHGVVISKRQVKLNTSTDKGALPGAVAGGAVGASLGSTIGNVSPALGLSVFALSTVTGAVLGGVAGDAIDKAINQQQAYEYLVKLKSGKMISVVQNLEVQLAVHQKVLVVYGARTRLLADTVV